MQWNPHPSRSQYIVSTSSEKMLIWNLNLTGKTSIEHILRSHYRAITDFNWHTSECDVVASTGIDSWIFVWDLRTPQKPAYGLSDFKDSGTHVKWNRHDGNFLASAHGTEVLIWDRRKGSLPMTRISAHGSKIYGIDWSHHLRNEIVTCSLDKTIKTWDTNDCKTPKSCIQTDYPVWRARNLPFGQGVLCLPQRGKTHLEMFARGETPKLVETFDGHTDVVKEFVWRKGAPDEFQLITWSKDRTLRFWPVSADVMQVCISALIDLALTRTTESRIFSRNRPRPFAAPTTHHLLEQSSSKQTIHPHAVRARWQSWHPCRGPCWSTPTNTQPHHPPALWLIHTGNAS